MRSIVPLFALSIVATVAIIACRPEAASSPAASSPSSPSGSASTQWMWSYDPKGPCHDVQIDAHVVPPPDPCPPGFHERADGATTAYCANGFCKCTNWIDCEHAKDFAWGCVGEKTPWLPMRARVCER